MDSFLPFSAWLVWWQWLLLGCGLILPYCGYLLANRKNYEQPSYQDQSISFWGVLTIAPLFVGMLIIFILWIICLTTFYWVSLTITVTMFFYSVIAGENYLHQLR
ncbi:MAG: hypothetical protein V1765_00455 [bacterium]